MYVNSKYFKNPEIDFRWLENMCLGCQSQGNLFSKLKNVFLQSYLKFTDSIYLSQKLLNAKIK